MNGSAGYLAAVRRQWLIVLVAIVLGIIGGGIYDRVATPVYSSTSQVLVAVESSDSTSDRLSGATYVDQIIPTYVSSATSSLVLEPVIKQLHLSTTLLKLQGNVTAKSVTGTALITITASASTARLAQRIATAVTHRFISLTPNLVSPVAPTPTPTPTPTGSATIAQDQDGQTVPPAVVDLTVVDAATFPTAPDSPRLALSLLLGLVAGLLVGIGVALARFSVDSRIRTETRIEQIVGAPIIGRLPFVPDRDWPERDEDPAWAESVRSIRSALFAWGDPVRTVLFCSATSGEGTSSTIVAVASALARAGVRTAVVDADLRAPALHEEFNLPATPGLADVLRGIADLGRVSAPVHNLPNLTLVPAGTTTRAGDLVASDALVPVLSELSASSEIVLVDAPAVVETGDALAIAHLVTSVILIVAMGEVTEQVLGRAVRQLRGSDRAIAGVVVTRAHRSILGESTVRDGLGSRP
jgi:polysaccharide biosynthesis transport protein